MSAKKPPAQSRRLFCASRLGLSAHFVAEHGHGGGRGGVAAQHERAERDRLETGGGDAGHLGGRKIPLGADQPDRRLRTGIGGGLNRVSARGAERDRAGVQAGDEFERRGAHEVAGEERFEFLDAGDLGQEGGAALFRGFERGGAPLLGFFIRAVAVEMDLRAFGGEGHDARGSQFGHVADDVIHHAAFGQRLGERDRAAQGGAGVGGGDAQGRAGLAGVGEFAGPFGALTVESDDGVTGTGAVDGDEVVRFAGGQGDGSLDGRGGEDAKI